MDVVMLNTDTTVCILLATYNGARFIAAQLDSLINQTYTNWHVYIRDDKSKDNTPEIVQEYSERDTRINVLRDSHGNVGSCQNFALLLYQLRDKYEYFMFCDQDDVWLPFKIEYTLAEMHKFNAEQPGEVGLLVHTRFEYVDTNLEPIGSKQGFSATKLTDLSFNHLLAQNPAYGCTMMFNRELVRNVQIPLIAENHDYWIALVASAFGKIRFLEKPTILYRQHDNNISTNHDNSSLQKRVKRNLLEQKIFVDVRKKFEMAEAFKQQYYDILSATNKQFLDAFLKLRSGNSLSSLVRNIRNGVRRQTLPQTVLFYIAALMLTQTDGNK